MTQTLPADSKARKDTPLVRGCLDYFPAALAAVARLSKAGNDKHNPGEEMHHARGKSTDHADCIVRHLADRGTVDPDDGIRHSVKVAWRALALLQEELEREEGAPLARGARLPEASQLRGTSYDKIVVDDVEEKTAQVEAGKAKLLEAMERLDWYTACRYDGCGGSPIMVPNIAKIHDPEPEWQECENDIHQRIAGDGPEHKHIKNSYYYRPGKRVYVRDAFAGVPIGSTGTVVEYGKAPWPVAVLLDDPTLRVDPFCYFKPEELELI